MPSTEQMTIDERRKYLRRMQVRYAAAKGSERSRLLDEMAAVTELHRKSLIRLLKGDLERHLRQKQRGRRYGSDMADALRVISESFDYICAERMTPNLGWMAQQLVAHGELVVSEALLAQLQQVSVSSVRRLLERLQQDQPHLPRKGPEQANQVRREIPMKRIAWQETQPGHFEVDLVHHCGSSAEGEYGHTLQMVDVATGWSERVVVLGRSYLVMEDGFRRILQRLPVSVRELHPDNGSEFLNAHLIRFWKEVVPGLELSRSRPYQKNDNRFVEQKNATLVRAYLGHKRLDAVLQMQALNQLYEQMWLYYNFFQPVMHLQEKTMQTNSVGTPQVKRHYDVAHTPFERLCATQVLSPHKQQALQRLCEQTNPRRLRQQIYDALDQLFMLPTAAPGVIEDVRRTLLPCTQAAHTDALSEPLPTLPQLCPAPATQLT